MMGTTGMRNHGRTPQIMRSVPVEANRHRKKSETMSGISWSTTP
jgi:hypothetical protein